MCVIVFSPKGVDIPTEEQIKTMWEANPDGAGYAYVGKGKPILLLAWCIELYSLYNIIF